MSGARRKFASVQMVVVPGSSTIGETRINGFAYIAVADDGTAWEGWQPRDGDEIEGWHEMPALPESQGPKP